MRRARRGDYYRRAFHGKPYHQLTTFKLTDGMTVGSVDLKFESRITALCGANGSGKTTILHAIANLLEGVNGQRLNHGVRKLNGASASASIVISPATAEIGCAFRNGIYEDHTGRAPVTVIYLDPSARAKEISSFLETQENFDELIAGLGPSELDAKKLDLFRYVLKRHYTKIDVYEIEEFSELGTFPYFVIEFAGTRYDSTTLGLGELTAMLVLWELYRLPADPTILLLEEPETHVSPRSQSALVDAIVMFSTIRRINVVISTHSANVVEEIPNQNIKYLVRTGGSVSVVDNPTDMQLEEMLGKTPRFRGVALVEDELAQVYLKQIVRRLDPELLRIFDFAIAGDFSRISTTLSSFPFLNWLQIDGIFDGDLNADGGILKVITESNHSGRFLPLTSSIESTFMLMSTAHSSKLAERLKIDEPAFSILLASLEGSDPHDWFRTLADSANVSTDELTSLFVDLQFEDAGLKSEIETFVQSLRNAAIRNN